MAFLEEVAREALRLAQHKLPIKTKIVTRADQDGRNNEVYRNQGYER